MAKKKKSEKKVILPPHRQGRELLGFGLFAISILLLLSLFSFAYAPHTNNWMGMIGYSIGWVLHSTLGVTSYLFSLFLAWIGWRTLFNKSVNFLEYRILYLIVFCLSLGMMLSLIEDQYPLIGKPLKEVFYPASRLSPLMHLGGLPIFFLYKELPQLNFLHIFNTLGIVIIFGSTLFFSALFFFRLTLSELLEKLKKQSIETEIKPKDSSSDHRFVKLSLPKPAPMSAEPEPAEENLLVIQPKREIKLRPSITAKSEVEPSNLVDPPAPKPTKREAALQAQSVYNGNYQHYKIPPLNILTPPQKYDPSSLKSNLKKQAEVLEETLLSFGIEAKVGQINCGPRITSFEVHPSVGVKVQRIKALENDIALNMEATSIRIIAPIPGKAAVGVEVPNATAQEVNFRDMMTTYQRGSKKLHIPILLGKAVDGEYVMSDLAKMPHCIIAGATGSGKSVCINTIVMSILYTAKPDEIQLLMIDPKKVELTPYSKLPHMIAPVITEPTEAYTAMQWLVREMEQRYNILNKLHFRNIEAFNTRTINKEAEEAFGIEIPAKLPYIVGIVDELADLMMSSNCDIETPIARIAQMARAVGIHLILATQRPSREVITGLIKANFPTRICFNVSSGINSKIVIDAVGAEQLLGNGDMLFLAPGTSNLARVQGAFIRDDDIHKVIQFINEQAPPNYRIPTFNNMAELFSSNGNGGSAASGQDPLYEQAFDIVVKTGNASTTFLQRKLKIGYARAASLMDQLESQGVVSAAEGSKARTVLARE